MNKTNKDQIIVTFTDLDEPDEVVKFGIDIKCKPYDGRHFDPNILILFSVAVLVNWVTIRKFPQLDVIEEMPESEQARREVGWKQAVLFVLYASLMLFLLYYFIDYIKQVIEACMSFALLFG